MPFKPFQILVLGKHMPYSSWIICIVCDDVFCWSYPDLFPKIHYNVVDLILTFVLQAHFHFSILMKRQDQINSSRRANIALVNQHFNHGPAVTTAPGWLCPRSCQQGWPTPVCNHSRRL